MRKYVPIPPIVNKPAKPKPVLCHCGQPLHYTNQGNYRFVERMIDRYGENVIVTHAEGSWLVPRHYIALHGLKPEELPELGFKRAKK